MIKLNGNPEKKRKGSPPANAFSTARVATVSNFIGGEPKEEKDHHHRLGSSAQFHHPHTTIPTPSPYSLYRADATSSSTHSPLGSMPDRKTWGLFAIGV